MIALLAQAETGSAVGSLLFPVAMIAIFYLLLIRPQQRKAKAQQALVRSISAGDRVITVGGLYATVLSVDEDTMRLEIAPGTTVTMARSAVARKLVDADTETAPTDADGTSEA